MLYANQPAEAVDGFTDAYLLRGPAFDSAVKTMKYRTFVTASQKVFDGSAAEGTPTAVINDVVIPELYYGLLFDPSLFETFLEQVGKDPGLLKELDF